MPAAAAAAAGGGGERRGGIPTVPVGEYTRVRCNPTPANPKYFGSRWVIFGALRAPKAKGRVTTILRSREFCGESRGWFLPIKGGYNELGSIPQLLVLAPPRSRAHVAALAPGSRARPAARASAKAGSLCAPSAAQRQSAAQRRRRGGGGTHKTSSSAAAGGGTRHVPSASVVKSSAGASSRCGYTGVRIAPSPELNSPATGRAVRSGGSGSQ